MADQYLSGKTGFVQANGATYNFSEWGLSIKVGKPKITNFMTAPYQGLVSGIIAGTLKLRGPYNAGNMPLTAGATYVFNLGWAPGLFITVTCIIDLELTNDVEGNPAVMVNGESTGPMGYFIN